MNILSATNSHFKSLLEKYTFEINRQVQKPTDEDAIEKLSKFILKYNEVSRAIETLAMISQQVDGTGKQEKENES